MTDKELVRVSHLFWEKPLEVQQEFSDLVDRE
jgi:hypothetical protein